MTDWALYPFDYRAVEVQAVCAAVQAGECAAVVGLSGAGKSNLMGFLAQRVQLGAYGLRFVLVDCNRLAGELPGCFYRLARQALDSSRVGPNGDELAILEAAIETSLHNSSRLCLLFDRFDALHGEAVDILYSNLRALRDAHKYDLTYAIATRRPIAKSNELAELFFGNTLWLGPLSPDNARWSVTQYARRKGMTWEDATIERLVSLSGGYPAFLRAACEAHAAGTALEAEALRVSPAVQRRLDEFWADAPTDDDLKHSRLAGHPWLNRPGTVAGSLDFDVSQLTAKEHLLLQYLQNHPGQVCEKDELIRAVWAEDVAFIIGIRDDSLAQLVRRLRKKIEPDEAQPRFVLTIPGRGYRYRP